VGEGSLERGSFGMWAALAVGAVGLWVKGMERMFWSST
jgi:hypothetical protein